MLSQRRGIEGTHIVEEAGRYVLCLHYDADTISLDEVQRLAGAAGAEMTERYGHRTWPLRAVAAEDAGRRIEETLAAVPGVIAASVSLPAQLARVEFERDRFRPEQVDEALRGADVAAPIQPDRDRSWYARNRELAWSLYRAMALLVASSPCALALGTPATVLAGIAQAARRGVLIKGGMHLENLGTVNAIALDKIVNGQAVEIGNARLFAEGKRPVSEEIGAAVARLQAAGRSIMIVRMGDRDCQCVAAAALRRRKQEPAAEGKM